MYNIQYISARFARMTKSLDNDWSMTPGVPEGRFKLTKSQ